jgi:uncharacterized protein YbjQ (UPF0145 family)
MTTVQEPVSVREPIGADDAELAALRELRALLVGGDEGSFVLVGGEREAALTPTALYFLRRVVEHLANERAVRIETFGKDLSLWEAADILGAPIKHVLELIEQGQLPYREVRYSDVEDSDVDGERVITLADLRVYLRELSKRRREGLRELTRMAEEMGAYDLEDEICPPS